MAHEITFWLTTASIILVIYHHVGYPLLLKILVRKPLTSAEKGATTQTTPVRGYRSSANDIDLPTISVLMPAYNEEKWIADKIRNLAALDYPSNKVHVVLACDGCTDKTADIARQTAEEALCKHLNVTVIEYEHNAGKVAVINNTMPLIQGDIVALSDISALVSIDAFYIAAHHFSDANVGVLNSRYCLINAADGEQKYWDYQSTIQRNEAQLGSSLGAHGALYFIRRELFTPLAPDTINDDFVLPMQIVKKGFRADINETIQAVELEPTNAHQDFRRRLRIGAGNCQQLMRLLPLLNPLRGGIAFTFASGKGLRVLMPFFMVTALLGSALLAPSNNFFALAMTGQITIYLAVGLCRVAGYQPKGSIAKALQYLVTGHTANLIGTLRYITGLETGRWTRVSEDSKTSNKDKSL
ncbi:glycosyltransferase family 2 protein [Enterovibrio sp. ZSDZ42]|uniref:Glycosyltransferase family 2 protein n=1 Tax=Enterovibrio gelatinilyticus TaxID=2899819 RepID=A0ABT5R309_9GAMM|nr:glycosyltransferase family 2 protein [Enterovibrio sp. ZSDZ42]MDD1794662.1 glycosyltransferase family 2 protein [Enterovibrio sp. ZSDZ42]